MRILADDHRESCPDHLACSSHKQSIRDPSRRKVADVPHTMQREAHAACALSTHC